MKRSAQCVYATFKPYGTWHVIVIEDGRVILISTERGDMSENPMYVPVSIVSESLAYLEMDKLANWEIHNGWELGTGTNRNVER